LHSQFLNRRRLACHELGKLGHQLPILGNVLQEHPPGGLVLNPGGLLQQPGVGFRQERLPARIPQGH
jgi:hypothetical protein